MDRSNFFRSEVGASAAMAGVSMVLSGRCLYVCFSNSPVCLIAAQGNNYIGATGLTWNCKIIPIRTKAIDFKGIQNTSNCLKSLYLDNCNVLTIKCKGSLSVIPLDNLTMH